MITNYIGDSSTSNVFLIDLRQARVGLTETEDRHTFFFPLEMQRRCENLTLASFFPLLKKPKPELSRREPREAVDRHERALRGGESMSFLLSYFLKSRFYMPTTS